jgi:type VI secretion system protein ImpF
MGEFVGRERLQPALLDRLTDTAPEQRRESPDQQTLSMAQLRAAVLRDLAWLLNTTDLATSEELDDFPLAATSGLNFGIPGFTGLIGTSQALTRLETAIAAAIRAFEPRIRPDTLTVRARPAPAGQPMPAIIFEISGELWAQPVPQRLFLETAIELETRRAVVAETRGRG